MKSQTKKVESVSRQKLRIMVSSAVYGYQEFLDRIYDLLVALGYEVWMSHKGTIPVCSDCDTLENCMHGVESCDLFLGIITGQYGKTIRDGFSATHLEFKRAIELNKPRWFIVDDRVIFARRFLNGLYRDKDFSFVCAYLNGDGGNIVIGTGADVAKLLAFITPHAPVFFRKGDGEFYLVDVPSGNDKPYSCDGRFYVMQGDNAVPASADEIKDMLLAAQVSPLRWERWFSDGIGIENFDGDELQCLFADEARHSSSEVIERLERMGLSRQGRFTNATDVLLCKDVAARHPQIRARAIACMDKTDDVYQGHATFEGPLLKVFNGLNHFVMEHTRLGERFSDENPAREAIYQYPLKAIREGLINALVHRDYEAYEGTVNVEIHKDHLVISNTGGLYGGMTIERLKAGHLSAFRNPDMANYLNVRGFMEMTGRGSVLIQEACRANGLPEPQWVADESSVTLTFNAKSGMSRQVTQDESVEKGVEKGVEKSKEKSKEKGKEKSKEKILALLSANPHATTADLLAETGLSVSGVEKNIRELKAAGRLRRVGPDKGGHWEVVEG